MIVADGLRKTLQDFGGWCRSGVAAFDAWAEGAGNSTKAPAQAAQDVIMGVQPP
jgi:hypothetical protein